MAKFHSFLWLSSIMCVYHTFFTYSYIDEHLGCFLDLAIVYNAAMKTRVYKYFQIGGVFFFFSDVYLGMELVGHIGEGNGNPLQYSRLGNPMDRATWWAIVPEITKSWTRLSKHAHMVALFLDFLRSLHTVFHSACYFFVSLLSSFLSLYCYF